MPTTCPMTTCRSSGLPAISLSGTICTTLHSIAQGEAATRGGFTSFEGAAFSPATSISLTPCGSVADVWFICSRKSQVASEQTNSIVSVMLATESLKPSLENITIGGREETPLKYEYGARLIAPFALIDVIQPIGRGATIALNGSCGSP